MASPLPVPAPDRTPETDEFWDATATGRLLLARCDACGTVIWYPKTCCPGCGGLSVSWDQASGLGTIYSFSVVHRVSGPFRDAVPVRRRLCGAGRRATGAHQHRRV